MRNCRESPDLLQGLSNHSTTFEDDISRGMDEQLSTQGLEWRQLPGSALEVANPRALDIVGSEEADLWPAALSGWMSKKLPPGPFSFVRLHYLPCGSRLCGKWCICGICALSWMLESLKLVWVEKHRDLVSVSLRQLRLVPREIARV